MTDAAPASPDTSGIILLPSDRFVIRTVPLAGGAALAAQVELAVEGMAPFPPGLLYHGHVASAGGDRALVFAAYRKRFSAAETAEWETATAVLPSFLTLLGRPPRVPAIRVHAAPRCVTVLAWDGSDLLPVAVLARETTSPDDAVLRAALVAEVRERTGLAAAPVEEVTGSGSLDWAKEGKEPRLEAVDVRDKEFLAVRRALHRRDRVLWRSFQAGLGGLAAMLVLETGLVAGGIWRQNLKATEQQQAPAVGRIETAQALSTRIEELTQRRLLPFEMLALVNQNRPASVQFVRTTTTGLYALEVEAQTANASDVGQYEAVLRAAPGLAGVETRDLRSRDGLTTFTLSVTFKPESLQREEGT